MFKSNYVFNNHLQIKGVNKPKHQYFSMLALHIWSKRYKNQFNSCSSNENKKTLLNSESAFLPKGTTAQDLATAIVNNFALP